MHLTRCETVWLGPLMRGSAAVGLATIWLAAMSGFAPAWPQSAPSSGTPASGAPHDKATDPAAGTAKRGAQKAEASAGKTPVVPPHGQIHPHKPPAGAGSAGKAAPQAPAPAEPVQPPAETKAPEKPADADKSDPSAPKLPRFASLRSDDVNMRAGPGTRYRIDWVYKRRDLPVEIDREFEVWRWVRDADGIQGWVHQATLTARRSFIVQKADATLRSEPNDTAAAVAILKPGVIGRIRFCEAGSGWCNMQTGSHRGYLRRDQVWGLFPGETVAP